MENNKLISMVEFVIRFRSMTTSDLCKNYPNNFKLPLWKGSQSEMVKDMLAIDAIQWKLACEYAKFLSQPLTLGMFVPCDEKGNTLDAPDPISIGKCVSKKQRTYEAIYDNNEEESYLLAKSKVLFEGFEIIDTTKDNDGITDVIKNGYCYAAYKKDGEWSIGDKNIESLIPYNLTLTEQALKKIWGNNL